MHERHHLTTTVEYDAWAAMRQRCLCAEHPAYKNYGARGIGIAPRWERFENFLADMGPRPSREHSLDRIDNELGYFPGNCRWATRQEQNKNRRNNKWLEHGGEKHTMADWARKLGISRQALKQRLENGWSVERALTPHLNGK